ncbi:hypothetical protein CVT26_006590 [Gymnopilus dilepis]|uniref:Uncharacterized protein n=1 Tax=Gymnopilus dilepis TaxID=231916 RepID=A0A409Y2T6_9AGAR|nr:hypothetical protein CVT26_006590 [Gymnopilus dilepis]
MSRRQCCGARHVHHCQRPLMKNHISHDTSLCPGVSGVIYSISLRAASAFRGLVTLCSNVLFEEPSPKDRCYFPDSSPSGCLSRQQPDQRSMLFICSGYPNLYVLMPYPRVPGPYIFPAAAPELFVLFPSFQIALFLNQRDCRAESAHSCSLPSRPCAVDQSNLDYAVLITKLTSGQSSTMYYDAMSITPGLSRNCLWVNVLYTC